MRRRPHWLTTHRAARSPRGDNRRGFRAEIAGLFSSYAAGEGSIGFHLTVQVVRHNNQAILRIVVTQLHPTHPELLPRLSVELRESRNRGKNWADIRKPFEHLLECQSQGIDLLLLHPNCVCLAVDDRDKPESSLTGLANGFYLDPLRVEIPNHVCRTTPYWRKIFWINVVWIRQSIAWVLA